MSQHICLFSVTISNATALTVCSKILTAINENTYPFDTEGRIKFLKTEILDIRNHPEMPLWKTNILKQKNLEAHQKKIHHVNLLPDCLFFPLFFPHSWFWSFNRVLHFFSSRLIKNLYFSHSIRHSQVRNVYQWKNMGKIRGKSHANIKGMQTRSLGREISNFQNKAKLRWSICSS